MEPSAGDRFLRLLIEHTDDPVLLEATVRAARGRSELVAALPEEETRRHTRALVHGVLAALEDGRPSEEVLAAAERLGSDRARQGVPVAAFLDGFQAGRAHLVRALVADGRRMGVPDAALLDGVTRIDEITTALVRRMVHAHRVAELEMARTVREGRLQMLRQLLHGESVPVLAPLDPRAAYHCVVSDVSDPAVAGRLESALTAAGPGLCGLVDGRLAALVARLPGPRAPVAGPPGPLLVAAPPARPGEIAPMYALGRRALRAGAAAGLTGMRELADLALLTATEAEPELGGLLAGTLLPGLDPGEPFHRDLAETALAYLDHGGRIEPTAAALHVHGNTVKYRIRRFQELAGRPLLAPGAGAAVSRSANWWWALHRWLARSGA
ncbi:helix-turn-helix domain-containing protein [Actinomadura mexicana]|uniref:PucR C-terminal helix-turn-helix domain-containing protein n=1 Tax=Actinomadura mexicana TaxID=134959 RepID=A0A239FDA1_9ACTN|nr:helix-turn-helix domain-containing protein [Actinomadura mexicana]SNS54122.1 PucR C-terminal helix-turn-helix domain-containing protein [Actinomadura mexicana]